MGTVPSMWCCSTKGQEEQTGESFSLMQDCLFFHIYVFVFPELSGFAVKPVSLTLPAQSVLPKHM